MFFFDNTYLQKKKQSNISRNCSTSSRHVDKLFDIKWLLRSKFEQNDITFGVKYMCALHTVCSNLVRSSRDDYLMSNILSTCRNDVEQLCEKSISYTSFSYFSLKMQTNKQKEFEFICKMFPKPKAIVILDYIFPTILQNLSRITNITFYLSNESALFKTAYHPQRINTRVSKDI